MSGYCPVVPLLADPAPRGLDNAVVRDETAVMPTALILVRRRHVDFLLVNSCGCPGSPPR
jgi:hypothetical protein